MPTDKEDLVSRFAAGLKSISGPQDVSPIGNPSVEGSTSEEVGGGEKAPLLSRKEDIDDTSSDPNMLTWADWVWIGVHVFFCVCDGLSLHALLERRFKGALFFGGHTQFLGNWSLCLSLASHVVAIYTALAVEPAPKKFNIRTYEHRERSYFWQAMLSGTAVIFSTVVSIFQTLLLLVSTSFPMNDESMIVEKTSHASEEKFQRLHIIPDIWLDYGVPAAAWSILIIKRPRHWMGGASRFIMRKAILWQGSMEFGHTYAHYLLWLYVIWISACRILGGRWVYRSVVAVETLTSGVGFALFYLTIVLALHLATWCVWRVAHALLLVLPKTKCS